jgi:hypothetical protein
MDRTAGHRTAPAAARARRRLTARAALRYAWAAPATAVGLLGALAAVACGANAAIVDGVLEVSGGRLGRAATRLPAELRFSAITFGHVVLGTDAALLECVRRHERAHVRQYERWGVLFFPLYAGASLLAWLNAQRPYWHNHFERQARREAGEDTDAA